MPKTISATLETVAQGEYNSPHYLFEVALDSGTQYYTDNNESINFPTAGGHTYNPWDVSFSRIRNSILGDIDYVNVVFDNRDLSMSVLLAANEFQGKTLTIKKVFDGYYASASNYIQIFSGEMSTPVIDEDSFTVTVYSPLKKLQQDIPRRQYSSGCPWKFGSAECNRFSGPHDTLLGHWPLDKAHESLGANLVLNGTMEADDSSWADYGTPTTTERSSTQAHSGTYSWKVITDGSADEGIQQTIAGMTVGRTYLVTGWVYVTATDGSISMYWNGALLASTTTTGIWVKLQATVQYSAGAILYFYTPNTKTGTFYVDDVTIREISMLDVSGNDNHGYPTFTPTYAYGHEGLENEMVILDGTNDKIDMGDTASTLKAFTAWVTPTTTSEAIVDFDGGSHFILYDSAEATATGFVAPRYFVNNVETQTISATRHHLCVMTTTGFAVDDFDIGKYLALYGDMKIEDVRIYGATLNATSRQIIYDVTYNTTGALSGTYTSTVAKLYDDSRRTEANDFWNNGVIEFTSGALNGQKRVIQDFVAASGKVMVQVPFDSTPSEDDTYTIRRGCNKTSQNCKYLHNNFTNYGGFEMLPKSKNERGA